MLWVGLSGGIGSGKSTVSRALATRGATIIDADRLAREVVEPGSAGLAQIVARFGHDILTPDGALDRPALGRIVFADQAARRDLEQITHPLIAHRTRELRDAAPPGSVVVHDVPLLVELGYAPTYHLVIIVGASEQTRLDRLVKLRGMDQAEARQRIASQASDEDRRALADVWLENEGTVEQLREATLRLYDERLAVFLANLERGIGLVGGDTMSEAATNGATVLGASETAGVPGAADMVRLTARLQHLLGDALDGDLELDPRSETVLLPLADGVQVADVRKRLSRGGFPKVPGEGRHASADPGCPVVLTLREHTVSGGS